MYNMMKNMMGIKPTKKPSKKQVEQENEEENGMKDLITKIDKYADTAALVFSVMDPNYEGGDFCAGLTVGFEGRQVG